MNRSKGNNSIELPSPPMDENPIVDKPYDRKDHHRKGKGAQQKSNEKFRIKQNQKTQAAITDSIEEYKKKLLINVEKAFGSRIPPGVTKPQLETKPNTWKLADICEQTIAVVQSAGKIRIDNPEATLKSLQVVSAAQLEAKLFYSRIGSVHRKQWEYNIDYHQKMEYIASALPRNFSPIVNYIDQFGKFTLSGQEHVPWGPSDMDEYMRNFCTLRSMTNLMKQTELTSCPLSFLLPTITAAPPDGLSFQIPGHHGPSGRPMYMVILDIAKAVELGVIDAQQVPVPGHAPVFVPGVIEYREAQLVGQLQDLDFERCVDEFAALQHAIARKFKFSWPEIGIKAGVGTPIQLVASTTVDGYARAWSSKEVGTDVLTLGAIFNVAPVTPERDYAIYHHDVAAVECDVCVRNSIQSYVDTIHGDFVTGGIGNT